MEPRKRAIYALLVIAQLTLVAGLLLLINSSPEWRGSIGFAWFLFVLYVTSLALAPKVTGARAVTALLAIFVVGFVAYVIFLVMLLLG